MLAVAEAGAATELHGVILYDPNLDSPFVVLSLCLKLSPR